MKVHNMNTVHTLRVYSWSQVDVASLPFIVCWIGLSHMLSFYRLYSFCPTAVSRMLEMNTHVGFSVSYTEFTAYVKQRKVVGGGTVCWVWHYYLNVVFQASCDSEHWAEDMAEADCQHEMWVTFSVYLKDISVSAVHQFVWNSSEAIKIVAERSTNDLNNKHIHNVDM